MKCLSLPHTPFQASCIAYGCMKLARDRLGSQNAEVRHHALEIIRVALEGGINCFDHADIYCAGQSEVVFSGLWEAGLARREEVILQTKCGIRFPQDPTPDAPHRYDFSRQHIIDSVHRSLSRLRTEYIDILLLHRPDLLMDPDEVAAAFDQLEVSGKVRFFGVSNFNPAQMELLRRSLRQPIVVNQLEFSLLHSLLLDEGPVVNRVDPTPVRGEGTLEYCRLHQIRVQAWSPLAQGRLTGTVDPADEIIQAAAQKVRDCASQHAVSPEAILLAWILRHPAGIQPVIGTTDLGRLRSCLAADSVTLSREDWYRLYLAAKGRRLP